jgi:hypothetical protein
LFDIPKYAKKVFYPSAEDYKGLEDDILSKTHAGQNKTSLPTAGEYMLLEDSIIPEDLVSECGNTKSHCVYRRDTGRVFLCDVPISDYFCEYRVLQKRTA